MEYVGLVLRADEMAASIPARMAKMPLLFMIPPLAMSFDIANDDEIAASAQCVGLIFPYLAHVVVFLACVLGLSE